MSLNRLAVRMSSILALTNYYAEPWPTIAKDRVFDSRIDPIQGSPTDLVPTVSVYTDDDQGDGLSDNNGGPPFRRFMDLSFWLTLGMIGENTEAGDPTIVYPQTDAQLEGTLDLFEHQVRFALADYTNPWTKLFLGSILRITRWNSMRLASEVNVRLAARSITATIELKDDDWPDFTTGELTNMPLPANVDALLTAVQQAGAPRGDVAGLIGQLRDASIPHTVVLDKLRRIHFEHVHADQDGKEISPRPVGQTDDLNPD